MTFGFDFRDLSYFETIAELEHVGAAAEKLHRTQPALTASVRRLESACGATLFERSGRGIRLTYEGRVLLAWVRRIRLNVQDAQRDLQALGRGAAGHVRLGVVPTAAQFLLPYALQRLMHEFAQVTVKTTVALGHDLRNKLQAGELDFAVVSEQQEETGFLSKPIVEDEIVVVASRSHPLAKVDHVLEPEALGAYEWVLQPPGAPIRDWLDHSFDRLKLPRPHARIESDMLMLLPALLSQTEVLGFVSKLHFSNAEKASDLCVIPVPALVMRRSLVAIWRESSHFSAASQLLVNYLEQVGRGSVQAHQISRQVL